MEHSYRLVIACPDRVGIVTRVSQFISDYQGWLIEASYHTDAEAGWFFMRNEIRADSMNISLNEFRETFSSVADEFEMQWHIAESTERKRVIVMASQTSHCLADILYRWHSGDLHCDIAGVISNHDNLRSMVEWHNIDYHHIKVDKDNKAEANQAILQTICDANADVVVLARYMQIIPPEICQEYSGRIINIHHSFLPSFIGANPYQKAYERGVKLIGATCHYVTDQLDEGPIIEQDVERVSHRHNKDDMVRLGKDVEKQVLARGLRYHLEDRVLIHGNKTVILD